VNLRNYRGQFLDHLANISDEEFDQELFDAGIENQQQKLNINRELTFESIEVDAAEMVWGKDFYGSTKDVITLEALSNGETA
jgi:hypothetical protein